MGVLFLFSGGRAHRNALPEREDKTVKHTLQISVSKEPKNDGIAAVHKVSVRERLLRFLFGDKAKLTVIVPGDSVEEVAITEVGKAVQDEAV